MIESEQVRAIAELDDRKHCTHLPDDWERRGTDGDSELYCIKCEEYLHNMRTPDYLRSRDTIVPVIGRHFTTMDSKTLFLDYLYVIVGWLGATTPADSRSISQYNAVVATPTQLCEALLRATGKWKE